MASWNVWSCILVLLLCTVQAGAERRNLSDIRYRFTNCGKTGRNGPSYQDCVDYYTSIRSPIIRDNVLTDTYRTFRGSQSFQPPRVTLYNATVAGAAGGRGLCNSEYGKGFVQNFTLRHSNESFQYLILVGQKGLGPCDSKSPDPGHMLCQNPPTNPEQIINCSLAYIKWVVETFDIDDAERVFYFTGGAGGGGASSIAYLDRRPFVDLRAFGISGGGGGGSSFLKYNIVEELHLDLDPNDIDEDVYAYILNGKPSEYPLLYAHEEAIRGFKVESSTATAGAGGGFLGSVEFPVGEQDGKEIGSERDFAVGGTYCARSDFSDIPIQLREADGGFGGGGGGCGGGGGGGGYTGGAVLGNTNTVPGGGGYVLSPYFDENDEEEIYEDFYDYNTEEDGYVEIVAADCGCVHECVVYEEEDQFECLCPNDTQLAPDLNDCYYAERRDVDMTEFESLDINGLKLTPITFGNSSFIFSADVDLHSTGSRVKRQSASEDEDDRCVLMFVGGNDNIVLVTNPVNGSDRVNTLSQVSFDETSGALHLTNYTAFLRSSILVTGAVVAGTGDCTVGSTIALNISTRNIDIKINITAINNLLNDSKVAAMLLSQILQLPGPSSSTIIEPSGFPSPDDEATTAGLSSGTIALIIVIILLTTLLIFITLTGVIFFLRRRRKGTLGMTSNKDLQKQSSETQELSSTPYVSYTMINRNTQNNAGYEVLDFDIGPNEVYLTAKSGTNSHLGQFQLKHGVSAPIYNFTDFNRRRAGTVINDWNYPRCHLIFLRDLGEGQFGKVMLMKAEDIAGFKGKIPVAVKTLSSQDPNLTQKFMEEAELMKRFTHPNIVSLLGICNPDVDSAPLMILEYMPYGDLEGFLQNHRPTEEDPVSLITEIHFYDFATDVANALDFLSTHKYVHRDIAARNCLVGTKLHIKIADFGLARGVYDKDYYRIAGRAVLPVRWMAPECLIYGIFTTESDVWAYGTLLWEITSYGMMPLDEYEVQEIVEMAQQGTLQYLQPQYCPDDLYVLMCKCHMCDYSKRPSFAAVLDHLRALTEITRTDTGKSVQI